MKSSIKKVDAEPRGLVMSVGMGVLMGCALCCIVIIACALLLTYTGMSEDALPLVITITIAASAIFAGFEAAKGAENKGWLWGVAAGGIFAVFLIAMEMWVQKAVSVDTKTLTLLVLSLTGGGLGGVIGINLRK